MNFTDMIEYVRSDTEVQARRADWHPDQYVMLVNMGGHDSYLRKYRDDQMNNETTSTVCLGMYAVSHDDMKALNWEIRLSMRELSNGQLLHEQYIGTFWGSTRSTTTFTWGNLPQFTQDKWEEMASRFLSVLNERSTAAVWSSDG